MLLSSFGLLARDVVIGFSFCRRRQFGDGNEGAGNSSGSLALLSLVVRD
jgi:hypothetical protein